MTRLARIAWLWILLASPSAIAAPPSDGGGRDVTIALFSTHSVRAATITPLASNAWLARCAQCPHQPLTSSLHFAAPSELFAGGTLRITDEATNETRTATGLWHLRATWRERDIDVILTLPSERYVAAVLNAEAAPNGLAQSLRALAILARTYALNGTHFTAQPGHLPAQLCDSTQCQAMLLGPVSQAIDDATRATAGETVWFSSQRAEVFFSQSCGGTTEDAGSVWPRLANAPYLRSHPDPYCIRRDTAAWHAEVPLTRLNQIAQAEGWRLPANPVTVRIAQRTPSHRALRIAFADRNGATSTISASTLRFGIGRALGWNQVRSDAYDLGVRNGSLVFDGHGHGHGVGLCQAGASEMASEGKTSREILAFYFPGTAIKITPTDNGWQQAQIGPLTARTTGPLSSDLAEALQHTWTTAQTRFSPHSPIKPEIIFAPSTEIFRQLTAQPGWALASTLGTTITLQPESVLHVHDPSGSATLLHEMLHVLVETEATSRAPLWLREGLVEVLAGDSTQSSPVPAVQMPLTAIDDTLQHADSLAASQRAHLAAAARVHALIDRYGFPTVRSWLSSGVPANTN